MLQDVASRYELSVTLKPPGCPGEDSHMKRSRMLARKFELNCRGRSIWPCLQLYLTSKLYHLKPKKLIYRPLFRRGACASRVNQREWRKSSLGRKLAFFTMYSSRAPSKIFCQLKIVVFRHDTLSKTRISDLYT